MKALVHSQHGTADQVLSLADIKPPWPGPEEVLVKVHFTPVHPGDLHIISGTTNAGGPSSFEGQRVPGYEG